MSLFFIVLETQPKGFNSTGDYEDKQYKLTLVEIQNADYIPLLDFHYALLSKSKYGIKRDYTITFKEIDTPTELERAQINQTKAQTDSVYVQSGILSPDEVRDNLIKNPNSGYNDIQGELPEDEFNFSDEPDEQGGSENPQNPFSEDGFNLDEWNEEDHPRNKEGEFSSSGNGGNNSSKSEKNLLKYDKIGYSQFEEIPIAKNEKEMVRKALNTDLTPEERRKKIIVRSIRNWRYTVINNGFDDYTIIDVEDIE